MIAKYCISGVIVFHGICMLCMNLNDTKTIMHPAHNVTNINTESKHIQNHLLETKKTEAIQDEMEQRKKNRTLAWLCSMVGSGGALGAGCCTIPVEYYLISHGTATVGCIIAGLLSATGGAIGGSLLACIPAVCILDHYAEQYFPPITLTAVEKAKIEEKIEQEFVNNNHQNITLSHE